MIISTKYDKIGGIFPSPSRDLNTGPADYKSAALPTKPLRRHIPWIFYDKKDGVGEEWYPENTDMIPKYPTAQYSNPLHPPCRDTIAISYTLKKRPTTNDVTADRGYWWEPGRQLPRFL